MKIFKNVKHVLVVSLIILLAFMVTGCADTVSVDTGRHVVGFGHGLWHGMILPFAWFISLFSDSTSIYAVYNNGGWYDFGFFLGTGGFTVGSSAATK